MVVLRVIHVALKVKDLELDLGVERSRLSLFGVAATSFMFLFKDLGLSFFGIGT